MEKLMRDDLKNLSAKKLILSGIRCKVGNGRMALFGHDIWIGCDPLKSLYPILFSIAINRNASISSMGFWNGDKWIWTLAWSRELRVRDLIEQKSLLSLLKEAIISLSSHDEFVWAHCKAGKFTVKSLSYELDKELGQNSQIMSAKVWRGLVPPRIEIFVWLACHGKLNTKAKLAKLQIIPADQDLCPLCGGNSESVDHLFIHCPFSWKIWSWWLNIWHVAWVTPSSIKDLLSSWSPPCSKPFFKKVWWAILYIIIWSTWKERNERVFNNTQSSINQICDLILTRLGWWIKGWGDPFPHSISEIISNPICLKWEEVCHMGSVNIPKEICWMPPQVGGFKWNVDASFNPSLNRAAIGGVLRNNNGDFICIFSTPIPPMEINNAEVNAIYRALQITIGSLHKVQPENLVIESDSLNAVKWCTASEGGPWNLNFHFNFIRNIQQRYPSLLITHQVRSANHVADSFAKQGLHRNSEFIAWL